MARPPAVTMRRTFIAMLVGMLGAASLLLIVWATLIPHGGAWTGAAAARFCTWCGPTRASDALANVALFVPLGAALVLSGRSCPAALLACALLTLGIEVTQYFGVPAGRIASIADLLSNVVGAAIGAAAARWRTLLLSPQPRAAIVLAASWALLCAAAFTMTAWAVSAPNVPASSTLFPTASAVDGSNRFVPSAMPFTPGFGWFEGNVIGALVNDDEIVPHGSGPLIVVGPPQDRYFAHLAVTGADRRAGMVPILYVHTPLDLVPSLLVAQSGSSTASRVRSRGSDAGFAALDLIVPESFDAPVIASTDTTKISARTSGRELSLVIERGARRWQGTLARTPMLGWAMVQSLVPAGGRHATALTLAWLVLLLLPLGYWGWSTRDRRAHVLFPSLLVIGIAIAAAVRTFGIAYPPSWQWYAAAAAVAGGMLLAQGRDFARHSREPAS